MKINWDLFGLLPYQKKYIEDESTIKIYEKSRRVGITRTQALEDVIDAGIYNKYDVWFSSNNDLNAREYIRYCKAFANALNLIVTEDVKDSIIEDIKIYSIEFKNGKRITGVSSSPEQLHGKGGKIVLDEFARRDNEQDVWEAAAPAALVWGYPIRIISTHNGKHSMFYQFLQEVKERKWSHHKTTIIDAVEQGIVDKAMGRTVSSKERDDFIEQLRKNAGTETIWQQQFMCIPQDEATSFMPYSLIESSTHTDTYDLQQLAETKHPLYIGVDVGRFNDLTVVWVLERQGDTLITRMVKPLKQMSLPEQKNVISTFLRLPQAHRCCIDQTGIGLGLTEELQALHGAGRVEGIHFTLKIKEEMAFHIRHRMEDNQMLIPKDKVIIEDFHGIRQEVTLSGNIRLLSEGNSSEASSHNDYFWAAALATHAAGGQQTSLEVYTPSGSWKPKYSHNTLLWNR